MRDKTSGHPLSYVSTKLETRTPLSLTGRVRSHLKGAPGKRFLAAILVLGTFALGVSVTRAGKPEIDPTYANGKLYYMIGPHLITNPPPALYAKAEELYLLVYPLNPAGLTTLGPLTLPSGYQPNCNPCFHPGLPPMFAYHDHVVTGAPGLGKNGTAGEYKAPWKIILLMYNPEKIADPNFKPITSANDIDPAEANGIFLMLNPGAPNPFEIETGNVLICPLVSPHA